MSTIGSIVTVGSVVVREPGEFKPLNINKREFAHLRTPPEIKLSLGKSSFTVIADNGTGDNVEQITD